MAQRPDERGGPAPGQQPPNPVDELSQIRMAIRALRARESALVAQLLEQGGAGEFEGCGATLSIRPHERRVLDESRLPPEIVNDARYWTQRAGHRLRVRPHASDAAEPAIVYRGDIVAIARRPGPPAGG